MTARSIRNLRTLYRRTPADNSALARAGFEGFERAIFSLEENPTRFPTARDDPKLRHPLYGSGRGMYRVLSDVDETLEIVWVLHIRHGARAPRKRGDEAREAVR